MAEEKNYEGCFGRIEKKGDDYEVEEPQFSILTGRPIGKEGSIREVVPDTVFFYRYEGEFAHRVTDTLRDEWCKALPGGKKSTPSLLPKRDKESEA